MQEFILQAGPVYAFMMVPILIPLLTVSIGAVADRFKAQPAPSIREQLAALRAREQEAAAVHTTSAGDFAVDTRQAA